MSKGETRGTGKTREKVTITTSLQLETHLAYSEALSIQSDLNPGGKGGK